MPKTEKVSVRLSNGVEVNVWERAYGQKGWTGGRVWEAAQALALFLSAEPVRVRQKRILELGCGCALVGLCAGALGAREVTLTDAVIHLAEANLDRNFLISDDAGNDLAGTGAVSPTLRDRFRVQKLHWGDQEAHIALLAQGGAQPHFDLILGSDIMHYPEHLPALAETINALSGYNNKILLATCGDWDGDVGGREGQLKVAFRETLLSSGFEISNLTSTNTLVRKIVEDEETYGGRMSARGEMTQIIEMTKKEQPRHPLVRSSKATIGKAKM